MAVNAAAHSRGSLMTAPVTGGVATLVPLHTTKSRVVALARHMRTLIGSGAREHTMWLQIGAAAGAIIFVVAIFKRIARPKSRNIDVGAVSDAWLAEHRARGRDSV